MHCYKVSKPCWGLKFELLQVCIMISIEYLLQG